MIYGSRIVNQYGNNEFALLQDRRAQNTAGSTLVSGAWRTIPLNTIVFNPTGIVTSLSSNQATLKAGVYACEVEISDYSTTAVPATAPTGLTVWNGSTEVKSFYRNLVSHAQGGGANSYTSWFKTSNYRNMYNYELYFSLPSETLIDFKVYPSADLDTAALNIAEEVYNSVLIQRIANV
jgi:hypothetical protein